MDRARPRSLYLPSEIWEAGRKRAKKNRMKISRFGWLCCGRATRDAASALQPAGHALALSAEDQQRLDTNMQKMTLFGEDTVSIADGREVTVLVQEVIRFLRPSGGNEDT